MKVKAISMKKSLTNYIYSYIFFSLLGVRPFSEDRPGSEPRDDSQVGKMLNTNYPDLIGKRVRYH